MSMYAYAQYLITAVINFVLHVYESGTFAYAVRLYNVEAPWYTHGIVYADVLEFLLRLYTEVNALVCCIFVGILFFVILIVVRTHTWTNVYRTIATERVVVLELFFMLIPTLCIIYILVPTLAHLYRISIDLVGISIVVDVCGRQWYWVSREIYISNRETVDTTFGQIVSLLERTYIIGTETPIVIPVRIPILLRIGSGDVIHSLAFPALGIKIDAIPGQIQECIIQVPHVGIYRGQCSELCGVLHSKMPLELRAVPLSGSIALRAVSVPTWVFNTNCLLHVPNNWV